MTNNYTPIPYQSQYYELLHTLLTSPTKIGESRVGKIHGLFVRQIRIDLTEEFPLMEIKQTSFKNILHELIWFIKGDTNIKYLIDNGCNIWNDDAYRWYNEKYVPMGAPTMDKENFLTMVKLGSIHRFYKKISVAVEANFGFESSELDHTYTYGDLDKVYGRQWKYFGGSVDQLNNIVETLKKNPDDRRMIITAHNPADIASGDVGLPSCHNYVQFYTSKGANKRKLSLFFNMRSADLFLGVPYNVASYSILLHMIAQIVDMELGEVVCNMVDCHLYEKHFDAANTWMLRYEELYNNYPNFDMELFKCKSSLKMNQTIDNINDFKFEDFKLMNYNHLGKIEAPLLT